MRTNQRNLPRRAYDIPLSDDVKQKHANNSGRWRAGEPFDDDTANDGHRFRFEGKYDGIYLAGFGNNRLATGKHDDLWARAGWCSDMPRPGSP